MESVPDMGSVFCFQPVAGDRGRGAEFHQDFEEIKNLHVLIVEDDEEMREHLKLQCSQLGVDATAAASGVDAVSLSRMRERQFDLCLIDSLYARCGWYPTAEWIRSSVGKRLILCFDVGLRPQEYRAGGACEVEVSTISWQNR